MKKPHIELRDGSKLQYHKPRRPDRDFDLCKELEELSTEGSLEIEIGCGKGEYIASRAEAFPDRYFVGIDRRKDRFDLTHKKCKRSLHSNWKILREDARSFLASDLPSIDVLHIYHPDPWPKAKHHKHRFFRSPDARIWADAIRAGGEFRIWTDHREYFLEIQQILESWGDFQLESIYTKTRGKPKTHFEGIFLRKREPVYKMYWRKKVSAQKTDSRPRPRQFDTSQTLQVSAV